MEDTSLENNENIEESNYLDNKDIKLRKRGRPKKKKESTRKTPEIKSDKEYWIDWIKENRVEFYNTRKKDKQFYDNVYKAYNTIYNSNRSRGKCGICDWNIIIDLKRAFLKDDE